MCYEQLLRLNPATASRAASLSLMDLFGTNAAEYLHSRLASDVRSLKVFAAPPSAADPSSPTSVVQPNHATFHIVFRVLLRAHLFSHAQKVFDTMLSVCGLTPDAEAWNLWLQCISRGVYLTESRTLKDAQGTASAISL
jgi:hypothetical protein